MIAFQLVQLHFPKGSIKGKFLWREITIEFVPNRFNVFFEILDVSANLHIKFTNVIFSHYRRPFALKNSISDINELLLARESINSKLPWRYRFPILIACSNNILYSLMIRSSTLSCGMWKKCEISATATALLIPVPFPSSLFF